MNIGSKIKELMQKQGITQKQLANRLNVQEATISRYISNDREPNAENLANIATALNTTVDFLLNNSKDSEIDCDFGKLKFFVTRNATNLTNEEKIEIINILLKSEDNK